ncbi:MAG TPA: class I SAM-dependent methyltransferase [Pseudonocardia sp.]|nr:class I SAM-dependent methyltransferase [Pseudonocardia sp.]
MDVGDRRRARWAHHWDKTAAGYDQAMRVTERVLFRDTRAWICGQATGDVLEVAVGTGLNLPHYPAATRVTGIDASSAMLAHAERRAAGLGRDVELRLGDAEALDAPDAACDTVVCTFSLCAIPDEHRAVTEMVRVLRPGGTLLLADHVASSNVLLRGLQGLVDLASVPLAGEHFRRRPLHEVQAAGLVVTRRERFALGTVERLAATKP